MSGYDTHRNCVIIAKRRCRTFGKNKKMEMETARVSGRSFTLRALYNMYGLRRKGSGGRTGRACKEGGCRRDPAAFVQSVVYDGNFLLSFCPLYAL